MMVWRPAGGLSLAELLVSLAVLGLVLAGLFGILHRGVKAYGRGAADHRERAPVRADVLRQRGRSDHRPRPGPLRADPGRSRTRRPRGRDGDSGVRPEQPVMIGRAH